MILPGTLLGIIYNKVVQGFTDYINNIEDHISSGGGFNLPLYQWPLGMTVVLQMKTLSGATPYKLNLKIVTPLLFSAEMPQQPPASYVNIIKPITNFIIEPFSNDLNLLLCSPFKTKILTNPYSIYHSSIKLTPFSFSLFNNSIGAKDYFYTLNSVT